MTEQTTGNTGIHFKDFNVYDGDTDKVDITTVTLTDISKLARLISYDTVICEDVRNRCDTGDPGWFTKKIADANRALANLAKLSIRRSGYEMMTCQPPPIPSIPPTSA